MTGYGANLAMVNRVVDKLAIKEPMEEWDDDIIKRVVDGFLDERFPTVVVREKGILFRWF